MTEEQAEGFRRDLRALAALRRLKADEVRQFLQEFANVGTPEYEPTDPSPVRLSGGAN